MKIHNLTTTSLICILLLTTISAHAQTVTLDDAIGGAVTELSQSLEQGSMVAVLSIRTDSERMASYLIEEITSAIVNRRQFTVVDRSQLDLIQKEMQFQLSGEVSDESAQAIGKKLGAQVIITGTFEPLGDYYRFRLRIIQVETTAIIDTYSANIHNDPVVMSLLGIESPYPAPPLPVPDQPPTLSPGNDFTTGQRWGTWALNTVVPGLGSYVIMRDIVGGTVNLGLSGIGGTLLYLGITDFRFTIDRQKYSMGTPSLIAGSAILLGGVIFNITRSAFYHKPDQQTTALAEPVPWNIAILPGEKGTGQLHLSYTMRF